MCIISNFFQVLLRAEKIISQIAIETNVIMYKRGSIPILLEQKFFQFILDGNSIDGDPHSPNGPLRKTKVQKAMFTINRMCMECSCTHNFGPQFFYIPHLNKA